jgi:pimeloyl-ACP methyl ester carboxylesterase
MNGVRTSDKEARYLNDAGKKAFGIQLATRIQNNTHWFGIRDFIQCLGHEYLGIIDKPALDTAKAIRAGIKEKGEVFVVAHSQGSAIFKQSLSLLTPEEKSKIHYIGLGPEWIIDAKSEGLASATNILNRGDPVPTFGNRLKFISNLIFPWNWGRLSFRDVERQDAGVRGLAAHGFEHYEEAVRKWAEKWKEHWTYGALQQAY